MRLSARMEGKALRDGYQGVGNVFHDAPRRQDQFEQKMRE